MSITLQFRLLVNGVLADANAVVLSDATGTYGVKRNDTGAVIVADGTAMTHADIGVYTYTFDEPAEGLTYTYAVEYTYGIPAITGREVQIYMDSMRIVTLSEAKAQLRISDTDHDIMLNRLIDAATTWTEQYLRRNLLTQTCVDYLDAWPAVIRPHWSPLIAVTSIQYVDNNGATQTWSSAEYDVDTSSEPGRILYAWNKSWPTFRSGILNPITVTYTAGYGTAASDVPEEIRSAILMLVAHWFEHAEAASDPALTAVPYGVESLLGIYRLVNA